MDEVADLLAAWGTPELIPTFAKNGVTLESLSALNNEQIKELVPLVGPRAIFIRSWKTWMNTYNENVIICENIEDGAGCNISLSALQDINLNILPEQDTSTQQKKSPSKPRTPTISPNKNDIDLDKVELMQLLKDDFEATSLIQYVGQSLPTDTARNLLALVIAKHILKLNKNNPVTGILYHKWSKDIKLKKK